MTFKFHQVAKVSKGNKKNFFSNILTRAIAARTAQDDYDKELEQKNKKRKKAFYQS